MRYHNITKDDMLNGPGLRVVLWLAACSHGCPGCHNPITWDPNGGVLFDEDAKKELFEILSREYISGITFSGGDPLHLNNRKEVGDLILEISKLFPQKTIWVYTGYLWEEIQEFYPIRKADVVVDGKFIEKLKDKSLSWKGSSNQRVIDIKKSLVSNRVVLFEGA
ncbi:anaerobic ribonucleoside-triphosphate reductase-activating protein [Clostridia bacterium]|nr:anaerobic ribonucleoside-triphosphate reductase-activating protein [Clostridia bacterium]